MAEEILLFSWWRWSVIEWCESNKRMIGQGKKIHNWYGPGSLWSLLSVVKGSVYWNTRKVTSVQQQHSLCGLCIGNIGCFTWDRTCCVFSGMVACVSKDKDTHSRVGDHSKQALRDFRRPWGGPRRMLTRHWPLCSMEEGQRYMSLVLHCFHWTCPAEFAKRERERERWKDRHTDWEFRQKQQSATKERRGRHRAEPFK